MLNQPTLTRRAFLEVGGSLCVFAALGDSLAANGAGGDTATLDATKLASWLDVRSDGTVVVRTGRTEMGVGMSAYYRQMVAEELSMRPERVDLVMGDTDRTPDGGWSAGFLNGAQNLRKVAAYTYQALLGLAATRLGVPVSSLEVVDGVITTRGGPGARVSYADLLKGQQLDLTIPVTGGLGRMNDKGTSIINLNGVVVSGSPPMKSVSSYTVIGRPFVSPSVVEKVTAKTEWVGDLRLPGMLHARMVRPATLGSTLVSAGALDRAAFPTAEVVTKGNLVAVVSPNEWEAVTAARAVAVQTKWTPWSGLPGSAALTSIIKTSRPPSASQGDATRTEAAMAGAAKTVSATYEQPFLKHAPIGPFIAVADVRPDGSVTVWTHSAQSQGLRAHLAYVLQVPLEHVTVRWLEGAAQYGRTTLAGDGAEADAVILSQLLGRPVRVQWTLKEDFAWSGQSPAWVADGKVGLDAQGKIVALQTDFYAAPSDSRMVGVVLAGLREVPAGGGGAAPAAFWHNGDLWAHIEPRHYDIPTALHRSYGMARLGADAPSGIGLRGAILRTPSQREHIFALESLLNEAAAAAGKDAIEFRLAHTSDRRLIDILNKTAEAAGWKRRPSPGPDARRTGDTPVNGRGVCFMYRSGTYWAAIADVEVTPGTGVVKVTKVTAGVDPGKVINPLDLRRNVEGGIAMGSSHALFEELTFDQEKITSTDWSRYRILTMGDLPGIEVVTISRDDEGFGAAGEAPNALPAPAIAAAIFDATGVQPRRTPFKPAYMQRLLKG